MVNYKTQSIGVDNAVCLFNGVNSIFLHIASFSHSPPPNFIFVTSRIHHQFIQIVTILPTYYTYPIGPIGIYTLLYKMMFIPEILDMLDDMLVDMVLNVSSFNNASTTSILSAMELLNYNDNEIFEHGVAALTTALQSRLSNFLFLIVSLIWTRIQHKNILILTELKERIIYVWTQRNRGRGAQSKSRDGDTAQDEPKTWSDIFLVVLFIGLMHVAMYRVYLEPCQIQPFVLRYTGKLLISSIPLLLPRSFYSGWPTLSKFFIMLWGKLWVSDVNMAMVVIGMYSILFVSP